MPAPHPAPAPFIVGAIRSGTTLLRLMLDAHPQLAIPPETSFPKPFFRDAAGARTGRQEFAASLARMQKFADFGISEHALARALPAGAFPVADGLRGFYRAYAARFAKPRWGDKSPRYVLAMRVIERVLPEARFIHVIRDGRDTLVSQREAKAGLIGNREREAAQHARIWQRCILEGARQGARVAHYLEVRYERLVQAPESVLREVCAFLELEFDARMLRYHERSAQRLAEMGDRLRPDGTVQTREERLAIFRMTGQPPDATRIGRWRDLLPPEDARTFEQLAGQTLRALGCLAASGEDAASPGAAPARVLQAEEAFRRGRRSEKSGEIEAALAHFAEAARLAPREPRYLGRRARLQERLGRYGEAWDGLSQLARLRSDPRPNDWSGESIAGRSVLVRRRTRHLGAEIRQARFIARLASDAASCTVAADPRLVSLFARSFPRARILREGDAMPDADVCMGYEDAACVYGRTEQALADGFAPLIADAGQVREFRAKYGSPGRRVVGVSWTSTNERKRLPALGDWRALLVAEGCRLVSLQYGEIAGEISVLGAMSRSPIVVDASVDQLLDMDRFAAQVASLDTVVTISCTAAHLAGALGVPTILLLEEYEAQPWPYAGERSPWYPRLRILRREGREAWADVMRRAAAAIASDELPRR